MSRSRPPAPGEGSSAPGRPPVVPAPRRPSLPGRGLPDAPPRMLVLVPDHAADTPPLAPRARTAEVDVQADREAGASLDRPRGPRSHPSRGAGEPAMGLRPDPGGAPKARRPRGGHDHPPPPPGSGPRSGAETLGPELDRVPADPGPGHPRLGLLHRRDGHAEDLVCAVLHRARHETRAPPRSDTEPRLGLGGPAGPEPVPGGAKAPVRCLVHDRDSKYSGAFDEVFRTEGARVILTPFRAPRANAFAERWVRTVRSECLDWTLVIGRRHLDRVLRIYVDHYNRARPHRGLELATPQPRQPPTGGGEPSTHVRRRDVLGGLIHEYEPAA
jgi:hypothetical protein